MCVWRVPYRFFVCGGGIGDLDLRRGLATFAVGYGNRRGRRVGPLQGNVSLFLFGPTHGRAKETLPNRETGEIPVQYPLL